MRKITEYYTRYSKYLAFGKHFLAVFGFSMSMLGISFGIQADGQNQAANPVDQPELLISQGNALISQASPNNPEPRVAQKIGVVITAYSSTEWQTDDTPFVTASGARVKDGIVANNWLPFGTKIRIPELYGDKIFVVEDRMSWQKGNYHFDIWFPDYKQAVDFGAKKTYIEVLEG